QGRRYDVPRDRIRAEDELLASGKAHDYPRSDDDKSRPCRVRCARSLPLDAPEPVERRGNVIPAVRGVGAALECGVGARKGSCKPNELPIPTTATKGDAPFRSHAQNTKQPAISSMAATANTSTFFMAFRTSRRETRACPVDRS